MTVLLWLLAMVPPPALFLIAGIWEVRMKYGGVRRVLGEAANLWYDYWGQVKVTDRLACR